MDYLSGQPLIMTPPNTIPTLLGETHAALHTIDPHPLISTLHKQGVDEYRYSLNRRFDWLKEKARTLPWIGEGVRWLIDHRPPDPGHFAVCHGDFHPLNILVDDGTVTGVLDWPGFAITDPVFDVANTLVLLTIPAKHLAASWEGFSSVDWDSVAELYVSAYRTQHHLDSTNIAYYKVRRCVAANIEGVDGQKVWQHPLIVNDLIEYIHQITGIQIIIPA
jgi:aminoglycoside phosphotransferase (APT) family kinase protein